ncbi:hypothetical protein [Aliihoeflea sp. 40Bstr573]|uniref:hypothetical protein n=1 Tax=Aliihoeflea sp. 40Bstr573 TaxID=2696467 RepID=UPI0020951EB9|nr:hypothetical protein [Aliihoeflea sp. 40Bstr573]MCO6388251.1 hypothetical protein [Aliihoeflea sp. 40Bstr573]
MYRTNTVALQERKETIKRAVGASKQTHPFHEYQNARTDLPVIRLEIGLPVYRMENYRTRTAQLKFIHDHGKDAEFFRTGLENEAAQQAQHDLLVTFAKQGRAASVSPIIEELKTEEQRDPLLLSASGVVVNGNRRLAAIRELFTEDPQSYRHFSHVDCAILPENVTAEEMREIEVRLQMRPETKLPYEWVNESLAIQELMQSGRKTDNIADLMKKKRKDVERAARALTEAELYLKEWLREPGEYQLVEDGQQFFNDLAKALENKEGEALEVSRRIAWSLFSSNSRNKLSRRVYDYGFSFDRRTDEVVSQVVDRLGIELTAQESEEATEDQLDIDLGDDEGETTLEPLIEAFDDAGQRDTVSDALVAVCDSIIERDKQGEIGRRALAAVQAANAKLQEVDLSKADPDTYASIAPQLESVIERATKLRESLQAYQKS